jgi:hypothetical protein
MKKEEEKRNEKGGKHTNYKNEEGILNLQEDD